MKSTKKLRTILLSILLTFAVLCAPLAAITPVSAAMIAGDINGDGNVNNRDLSALQKYLNEWEIEIQLLSADVNADGSINNRDLSLLQKHLNEWDVVLKLGVCTAHADKDNNGLCDSCAQSIIVYVDLYGINDLHGKFTDTADQPGVDELTTYFKNARKANPNTMLLAAGDMWQGGAVSNLTYGQILTDWMNELDFAAMALGNHDYDWGEERLEANEATAEFPFLAINVYDSTTKTRVPYCDASTVVDYGTVQIGVIGAIGDCYSSVAADKAQNVYFKVGDELTALVKAESSRLRQAGADFIVYVLHDGYGSSSSSLQSVSSSDIDSYYDTALSNGYVDLVFEGHTHKEYRLKDEYGVYHLQNSGDNQGGISHAKVAINSITLKSEVKQAELVSTSAYQSLSDDPLVNNLLNKYADAVTKAETKVGTNRTKRNSSTVCDKVAELYYKLGEEVWGDRYQIVLGGGYLNTRSPYSLASGSVKYGDLVTLLPFDNTLMLCSIQGKYLSSRFVNTNNSDYHNYYGTYGQSVKNNIRQNTTYYVVVDSYTAQYAANRLTVVEEYDPTVFARDLLAEYIFSGGWS